jgi:hypothetical protein
VELVDRPHAVQLPSSLRWTLSLTTLNPLLRPTNQQPNPPDDTAAGSLQDVFASFAKFGISAAKTPPSAAPPTRRFDTNAATPGSVGKGAGGGAPAGVTMDGFRFAKLCREAGLVDGKKLSQTTVDLIFTKVKAKVRFGGLCVLCGTWPQLVESSSPAFLPNPQGLLPLLLASLLHLFPNAHHPSQIQ